MAEEPTTTTTNTLAERKNLKKTVRIGKNVDEYDLKRMPPILRSKFYVYIQPPQTIAEAQMASQKRLQQPRNKSLYSSLGDLSSDRLMRRNYDNDSDIYQNERLRHERLIGQLKAAEARNRIRIMRMRYLNNRADDIDHLIQCQPTAIKAVRLEAFLPNDRKEKNSEKDVLTPIERRRLDALIDDDKGTLTNRLLY